MVDHITIRRADGTWTVRAGGAVLAESTEALEMTEGDHAPVIYFPRADIAMAFLEPSDATGHSPHMGEAHYYSIETQNGTLANAAWSYENPVEGMQRLKGLIAFHTADSKVAVERI